MQIFRYHEKNTNLDKKKVQHLTVRDASFEMQAHQQRKPAVKRHFASNLIQEL